MLRRFAAGSLVASVVVAIAALAVLLLPGAGVQRFSLPLAAWCFVPFVWGLWAMIAPQGWLQQRLPLWGAILGAIAGFFAMFVLNMPARVFGITSLTLRSTGAVVMIVFYYCLWMIVSVTYKNLVTEDKQLAAPKSIGTSA
jgi:hypothetical protein